jgi:hypothetical protein
VVSQKVFCDQNFLIGISNAGEEYRSKLADLVKQGIVTFVLGLWTLVEIARARDESMMAELAAIADEPSPALVNPTQ